MAADDNDKGWLAKAIKMAGLAGLATDPNDTSAVARQMMEDYQRLQDHQRQLAHDVRTDQTAMKVEMERARYEMEKMAAVYRYKAEVERMARIEDESPALDPIPPPTPAMKKAQEIMALLIRIALMEDAAERQWAVANMAGTLFDLVKMGEKKMEKTGKTARVAQAQAQNIGQPGEGGNFPVPKTYRYITRQW